MELYEHLYLPYVITADVIQSFYFFFSFFFYSRTVDLWLTFFLGEGTCHSSNSIIAVSFAHSCLCVSAYMCLGAYACSWILRHLWRVHHSLKASLLTLCYWFSCQWHFFGFKREVNSQHNYIQGRKSLLSGNTVEITSIIIFFYFLCW